MGDVKIALVYNPTDAKLNRNSYSQTYRGQFLELKKLCSMEITEPCSARDIDADVMIFYDVHSSHHIRIDGLASHPAIKYEYFNDPHQDDVRGIYSTGVYTYKLGRQKRAERVLRRGINFIICPFTEPYYEYIAPYLQNFAEQMLVWFPPSPDISLFTKRLLPLGSREPKILGNGSVRESTKGYVTRRWAHKQPYIYNIGHSIDNNKTPMGEEYPDYLAGFAASIALTDDHIVPKYLEIPLAGCVCFATGHRDYRNMGFVNGENCYFVDKSNLKDRAEYFLNNIEAHQVMADAGRKLIEEKWTAKHFAKFIYDHARKEVCAEKQ